MVPAQVNGTTTLNFVLDENIQIHGGNGYVKDYPAEGHFRETQGLVLSSLGIGTYLGQPDDKTDQSYTACVAAAVESGINVVDAAINYRFQRSERSVGAAIKNLAKLGIAREEFVLCTKGGYLTPDGAMPSDPTEYFYREYIQPGIFSPNDLVGGRAPADDP